MRSMTGFGTASLQSEELEASATVRSVNHRFLDLSVHLSRRLAALEPDVRKAVQAKLARGKVEVSLVARFSDEKNEGVRASRIAWRDTEVVERPDRHAHHAQQYSRGKKYAVRIIGLAVILHTRSL